MVDKVKNYGITGVAANVELGKSGAVISGSSADSIELFDNTGTAGIAEVAAGTEPEHAVNKSQLDLLALPKLSYRTFEVNYNSGTIALANVTANTYIHKTIIETTAEWTDADSNTTITVGDTVNNARLFTDFDPDVQTSDEADFRYVAETTINAYVAAGGATAGNALITVWYSGTLNDPPASSPAAPITSSGLILQLDASDTDSYPGTGTTWTDVINSYNGTLTNGAVYSADNGGVISLDGVNDYVGIADTAAIRGVPGSVITVQIWANISSYADNNGIFGKQFGSPTYDGYSLAVKTGEVLRLQMNGSSVNGGYNSIAGVWTTGTWHLFTAVVAFGGNSKAYVDTAKVIDVNNAETSIGSNTAQLRIGQDIQDPGDRYPTMKVGAFYIYNRELTAQEIADNYNATKSRYGL